MKKKEAYQSKLEAQVKEWNTLIFLLAAKMEKSGVNVKNLYSQELTAIRERQRDAALKIKELEKASKVTW